jgi:peptidyl-prolyl cis-trans isomerase A (cyclophilin A)
MRTFAFCLLLASVLAAEDLVARLEEGGALARYEAARALGARGAAARDALPALIAVLQDAEPSVRLEAGRAIVRIGVRERDIKPLVKAMRQADPDTGRMIAEALASGGEPALDALLPILEDEESRARHLALTAVERMGPAGAAAVPILIDLTASEDAATRKLAAQALRRLGPWAAEFVPELVDKLRFGTEDVRWLAASVLAGLGPAAKAAIPHLEALLKDGPPRLRSAAGEALKSIDIVAPTQAHPALRDPAQATARAPDRFRARLETTKGDIVIEVQRAWAPHGADRFYNLVRIGFFTDLAFFRTVKGFVAQFGIHGDRRVSRAWAEAAIDDDKITVSNRPGWLTFATSGPNSRTTQLFFNLGDNSHLDEQGFAPIGRVTKGWKNVLALYSGYGETPKAETVFYEGNAYLKRDFPDLDYIRRAVLLK